ncbi:hypothetical protein KFE25_008578 [Diacronema lutheri]|uniref:Uncharacterized protein n=2 Tax=Diacronema lutheri TaxID=2081491 RepID=A0A8J5XWW4_DIALT|nr:hypothetical protein KFE25_008578 [Diacronema lutheri]
MAVVAQFVCALLAAAGPGPRPALRRSVLTSAAAFGVGVALPKPPARAADPNDTGRLVLGYKEIEGLLKNWDEQTTTKEGARNADAVRKVLGLRSTSDPLFQLDKLLQKSVSKTDPDRLEEWIAAVDSLSTHVNNANEFAYTAAFGEYNPGGGKDQVEKYLEMSRKELVLVSEELKKVIDLLNLAV